MPRSCRTVAPRALVVAPLVASLVAATLHAQEAAVGPGSRVRVRVLGEHDRIVGALVGRVGDTLVVDAADGRRERLPLPTIGVFERSNGRSAVYGARRGATWGAAIGVPVVLLGGVEAAGGPAAVLAWTGLGAVVGAVRRPEDWRRTAFPAPDAAPPPVAVAPAAPRAAGAAVSADALPLTSRRFAGGERVRLRLAGGSRRVEGVVLGATADSIAIARGGTPTAYALADVVRADRYLGRTGAAGARRWARWGTIPGVLVGGTIGHELAGWGTPNPSGGDRVRGAVALGLLFGSVTGGVAGLVGAAVGADEWRRVPLGARVGLAPAQAGAGLAVRVPFGGGAGAGGGVR